MNDPFSKKFFYLNHQATKIVSVHQNVKTKEDCMEHNERHTIIIQQQFANWFNTNLP